MAGWQTTCGADCREHIERTIAGSLVKGPDRVSRKQPREEEEGEVICGREKQQVNRFRTLNYVCTPPVSFRKY